MKVVETWTLSFVNAIISSEEMLRIRLLSLWLLELESLLLLLGMSSWTKMEREANWGVGRGLLYNRFTMIIIYVGADDTTTSTAALIISCCVYYWDSYSMHCPSPCLT